MRHQPPILEKIASVAYARRLQGLHWLNPNQCCPANDACRFFGLISPALIATSRTHCYRLSCAACMRKRSDMCSINGKKRWCASIQADVNRHCLSSRRPYARRRFTGGNDSDHDGHVEPAIGIIAGAALCACNQHSKSTALDSQLPRPKSGRATCALLLGAQP